MSNDKQIKSIAVYRFLAMLLVVSGHLITVATYSYEIVDVIKGPLSTPILTSNFLASFDGWAYSALHTNAGSLAVVMFFIASGYLVSKMLDRYSRREFIINRMLSVFPTLWVSLIVVASVVYFSQGIVYSPADFLGSMFPFWPRISGAFVTLVLWTLRIEMKFYLLTFFFGKNRRALVIWGYMLILFLVLLYYEFRSPWVYTEMYDVSFMCFAFTGVVIEQVQRKQDKNGLLKIATCVLTNLLLFKISVAVFQEDRGLYTSCLTHLVPVVLFLLLIEMEKAIPKLFERIPRWVYELSKWSMPVYCTHTGCGLTVMYWMSKMGCGLWLTILGGFFTAFVVAGVIYMLVTKPSGIYMKKVITTMRTKK